MSVSPALAGIIHQPDEALLQAGGSPDLAAMANAELVQLGGWEVGFFAEADARNQLHNSAADIALEAHEHFRGIGNDAGAHTAVVGWSPGSPECVYVLDAEYQTAAPRGPIGAWVTHLALSEPDPSPLARTVLRWDTEPVDALPPNPRGWSPAADVASQLKGGGHLAFVEAGGCPVSVHKKGVRALINGKKKSKGMSKANSDKWDAFGDVIWRFDDGFSGQSVTRVMLPTLEVHSCNVKARGSVASLSSTHAIVGDRAGLAIVGMANDELEVAALLVPGFANEAWTSLSGTRTGWVAVSVQDHVILMQWDGQRLLFEGGWLRGSAGTLLEANGELYTQRYDQSAGWHPAKLVLR